MNKVLYILISSMLLLFQSCSLIFEEDISDEVVELYAPADDLVTSTTNQTFWWEELSGATEYTLEVVSPEFENIELIVLDTTIEETKFTYNFTTPKSYQWRVKALNNGYETGYTTRDFEIDSSLDLSGQTITILSPESDEYLNEETITIEWTEVLNAEYYYVSLIEDAGEGDYYLNAYKVLVNEITIPVSSSYDDLEEMEYCVHIYAQNSLPSQSLTAERFFTIDYTDPSAPELVSPETDSTLDDDSVLLEWEQDTDDYIAYDSVCVYTDSDGDDVYTTKTATDEQLQLNSLTTSQTYYWVVYSIDKAGNVSSASEMYSFEVE